ncbi:hypothetical protein SAMN05192558_105436 [Actinokineospora alba]|uniref:Uncharacterized protein n=1 Tax=Actinokineospora alba TaxID=504798 RepID=A0A1H0NQR6_9PSEU|nr:DUF5956 family protein [Actinokineospora alba]TDP68804.1 hypothetical protein C8E96_4371 [Actinokineospora alba]SDH86969.1 hypothetical protein SAMN05421871_102486 [Actinokineospora alba]SDO94858.1 hypothetical protein SAMN05192558_105436 [Actinokineospora alba]
MGTAWDRSRELAAPRPDPTPATLDDGGHTYHLVPDTGYSMLIAWHAGAENLLRVPDHAHHTVLVTTIDATGTRSECVPRTAADQDVIDEGIETYLADANVPAPPRGYRWYQRLPDGRADRTDFDRAIHTALIERVPDGVAVHPRDLAPLIGQIVTTLYR